jgi:hypothetical protein
MTRAATVSTTARAPSVAAAGTSGVDLVLRYAPRAHPVVMTALMRRTVRRTLDALGTGGLVVWSGLARIGKTTLALWMRDEAERTYVPDDPGCFRAFHYQVGAIRRGGDEQKRALRGLYQAFHQHPMDRAVERAYSAEAMARLLVHSLRQVATRLVFVDEAGNLSQDAIRGLTLVHDLAAGEGWTLAVVFIGMDDLPHTMEALPQIRGRIHQWCYFAEYDLAETWELLAALHPHFATLDRADETHRAQVQFIHDTVGGFPGTIVPYLARVDGELAAVGQALTLPALIAVHEFMKRDRDRAMHDAVTGHATDHSRRASRAVHAAPPVRATPSRRRARALVNTEQSPTPPSPTPHATLQATAPTSPDGAQGETQREHGQATRHRRA